MTLFQTYASAIVSVAIPVFVFLTSSTLATTFFERPFEETVKDAPNIVRGKTGNSYVEWSKESEGQRRIFTYYPLQITEVFKGSVPGTSATIRSIGGEKDGVGLQISGSAQFEVGEDVVVMLGEKNSEDTYDIRGLMMGKFNLHRDELSQEFLVGPGIVQSRPEALGHSDTLDKKKWTLDALRHLVREIEQDPKQSSKSKEVTLLTSPSPSTKPGWDDPKSSKPAAPQLQSTSPAEEKNYSDHWNLLWIGISLGLGGVGIFLMTRHSR